MKAVPRLALLAAVLAALAVPAGGVAASAGAQGQTRLPALESSILSALNGVRVTHGLRPLRISPGLTAAAVQHTAEMLQDDYFDHTSADGTAFDRRVARYYPFGSRYHRWAVGENLVYEAPDLTAAEAVSLWMASPEHRRNILDPTWRDIGIAAVHGTDAGATFGGGDVTIVTTDFGART
ncbi:MAG TPA: CAP domain-containing protein [Gaiellaceae bacterium]|nr:CAP domain-containing protein [Gaiellaceae bacterium]